MIQKYNNSIECAIGNAWNFEKIIKIKDKSVRYYILKRQETHYLEHLKYIVPKEAEELEAGELYCKFKSIDNTYYEEVIKCLNKLGKTVREIEFESLKYDDRTLEKLIKV